MESAQFSYGGAPCVRDVNLHIPPGEVHVLLGESGSGKTSVLRLVAGLERLASGSIRLGDQVVDAGPVHVAPEDRGVGLVFQDHALFPHLDVLGNVQFGMAAHDRGRGGEILERVGLGGYGPRRVGELSGGEQQRVAVARVLAQGARFVLLDEPFASLNRGLRQQLRQEVLSWLRREGVTTLLVTHDPDDAFFAADRMSVMHGGRMVQTGTPEEIYSAPTSLEAAVSVADANVLEATWVKEGASVCADTCLGRLPLIREPGSSDRYVVVRPEWISILSEGQGDLARVVSSRAMGVDRVWELDLPGGVVRARTRGDVRFEAGQVCGAHVTRPVAPVAGARQNRLEVGT